MPSQEYLKKCFKYNKKTGLLIWKKRPLSHFKNQHITDATNTRYTGKEAGSVFETKGEKRIMVWCGGKRFYAHRLIWKLVTGKEPNIEVDHKDRNPLNNSFDNLREASDHQNSCNKKIRKDNRIGVKGVQQRENGRYRAKIMSNGKETIIGTFDTKEEAGNAYINASKTDHKEFSIYEPSHA